MDRKLLALMILLTTSTNVVAAEIESLEQIRATARQYAEANNARASGDIEIRVGELDPRLRLSKCDQSLIAFQANNADRRRNATIGVRCPGAKPWSLYVPVAVTEKRDVLVVNESGTRGTVLGLGDIRLERHDVSHLGSGYYLDASEVIGKVLTRRLPAGGILTPQTVAAARLVRRGQQVELAAEGAGIGIRMRGTALADGVAGERIQVKNRSSQRIVEGIVSAPGIVTVAL